MALHPFNSVSAGVASRKAAEMLGSEGRRHRAQAAARARWSKHRERTVVRTALDEAYMAYFRLIQTPGRKGAARAWRLLQELAAWTRWWDHGCEGPPPGNYPV
jgi:hypothetical protein